MIVFRSIMRDCEIANFCNNLFFHNTNLIDNSVTKKQPLNLRGFLLSATLRALLFNFVQIL